MPALPPLTQIPPHLLRVSDYQQQARQHLSEAVWAYLEGGSGDELTLQRNQAAFDAVTLWPRALLQLAQGHTRVQVQSSSWPVPWMLAPIGHQRLFHADAEIATAQAAHALGVPMLVSALTSTALPQIRQHTQSPLWLQLYWHHQRDMTHSMIQLAHQAQVQALVLTVDAPVAGLRYRQQQAGFVLPTHCQPAHGAPEPPMHGEVFSGWMAQAPDWTVVQWLRQYTDLPIWLKGILHPADAAQALALGVDGLIVSNHGGRALDGAPDTLTALRSIRQAVGADFPLILDSGIRRGSDVVKAIVHGADAVLLGRPYIYGLATAGALGVAHVLKLLEQELAITMALCGFAHIDDIKTSITA